jgi:hypothetical protein
MRPKGITDAIVNRAIRDISGKILDYKDKGILYGLVQIMGNWEKIYYDHPTLSERLCCPERNLYRIIKKLESLKFVHVKRNPKKGRGKNNEYYLNYNEILSYLNTANMAVKEEINTAKLAVDKEEILPKVQINTAKLADTGKTKERHKAKEERAATKSASASPPPLSLFEPDEQNKILCQDLRLNLADEIASFRSRHSGRGELQYEFGRWLKASKEYQTKTRPKDEVRSTVMDWHDPNHPRFEIERKEKLENQKRKERWAKEDAEKLAGSA